MSKKSEYEKRHVCFTVRQARLVRDELASEIRRVDDIYGDDSVQHVQMNLLWLELAKSATKQFYKIRDKALAIKCLSFAEVTLARLQEDCINEAMRLKDLPFEKRVPPMNFKYRDLSKEVGEWVEITCRLEQQAGQEHEGQELDNVKPVTNDPFLMREEPDEGHEVA